MTRSFACLAVVSALAAAGCAPAVAPVEAPELVDPRGRLRDELAAAQRTVDANLHQQRTVEGLDRRLLLAVASRLLEEASDEEARRWTLAALLTRAEVELARHRGEAERRRSAAEGIDAPADAPPGASIDDLGAVAEKPEKKDELGEIGGLDQEEKAPVEGGEGTFARGWTLQPAPMGAMVQNSERELPPEVRQLLLAQGAELRRCAIELRDEVRFEVRAQLYQRHLRGVVVDARPLQPATVTDCVADVFASLELPNHDAPTQAVLFPFLVRP